VDFSANFRDAILGEIWSYGLRNPWRFSFDRVTGDMWIGDVHHVDGELGTNLEAVDFQPANSKGGLNFGFPIRQPSTAPLSLRAARRASRCRSPRSTTT